MKVILILLFLPYFSSSYWFDCNPCNCLINENDLKTGNCNKNLDIRDLEEIPENIDKEIKILKFKEQSLTILRENHFGLFQNLQEIYLSKNKISIVQENAFKNLFNLSKLDLGYNQISNLPLNIFSDTPNINYIWINNNKLRSLQEKLFFNLYFLYEIHLQENNIVQISQKCFINVASLSVIDLSYNNLPNLQLNIIDDYRNIKYFILHGNPWICDKSFCEFRETAVKNKWLTTMPDCNGQFWADLINYTINIIANKTAVNEDENVDFLCEYNSCISSELIWKADHKELKQTKSRHQDDKYISVLSLKNVDKSDEDRYICSVLNCENCQENQIYLNVTEKPKIIKLVTESQFSEKIETSTVELPETTTEEPSSNNLNWIIPSVVIIPIIFLCCCCCFFCGCCKKIRIKFQGKSKPDRSEEETIKLKTNI